MACVYEILNKEKNIRDILRGTWLCVCVNIKPYKAYDINARKIYSVGLKNLSLNWMLSAWG